jgi:predicted DNA-binding transcriptional regulator YafY
MLFILKLLLEKGRGIDEIIDILKDNPITSKSVSKDTVRLTIKSLKSIGCEILRPSKSTNFKYVLISHPFGLKLTEKDFELLLMLREKYSLEIPYDKVFILNNLYEKLVSLTNNELLIQRTLDTNPLGNIDKKILAEFSSKKLNGKKINIEYISPKYGTENIDIIPEKITYENGKLYLSCYIFKYKTSSVLKMERIKKINSVDIFSPQKVSDFFEVRYEVFGTSYLTFDVCENEKIIEDTKTSIVVEAKVNNEFLFVQRLLLLGSDFKIISPDFFREKLISKIKLIQKGYKL